MAIKDELREKVPEDILMTSEYKVLSSMISREKITTVSALKKRIDDEMKRTQDWLAVSQKSQSGGTMTRFLRSRTKRLDFLSLIKKKVLKYL